jgi:hypothetical protein
MIVEAIKKHNIKDAIVKIIYHVPAGKKDMVDLKNIQHACDDALDLIGVIPIHIVEPREKRNCALKVTMDLPELLDTYFATKPDLYDKKNDLIEKTMGLWQTHLEQQEDQ